TPRRSAAAEAPLYDHTDNTIPDRYNILIVGLRESNATFGLCVSRRVQRAGATLPRGRSAPRAATTSATRPANGRSVVPTASVDDTRCDSGNVSCQLWFDRPLGVEPNAEPADVLRPAIRE